MKFEIRKDDLYAAGWGLLSVVWRLLVVLSIIAVLWLITPVEKIRSEFSSMSQPKIAVINVNQILSEKSNDLKERLINAKTSDERAAIHHELNQHGEMLNVWLNERVPKLCGMNCIVLDERLVIRGAQIDLTPIFKEELAAQAKFNQEMSDVQQSFNAITANRN